MLKKKKKKIIFDDKVEQSLFITWIHRKLNANPNLQTSNWLRDLTMYIITFLFLLLFNGYQLIKWPLLQQPSSCN